MKIVIPDDWGNRVRQLDCIELLQGHEVVVLNEPVHDRAAMKAALADAEALVLIRERTFIDADLLDSMPRLRIVSQLGLVRRNLSIAECTARGIAVAEGPTLSTGTIELTWALILASRRCLPREIAAFKDGGWQTTFGSLLKGQTLGIWGYGRIGSAIAQIGKAFGMRVLVWGREKSITTARLNGFEIAPDKASLFSHSDVLSVHIRLTAETNGIITEDDFGLMKPDALFVNAARAELGNV